MKLQIIIFFCLSFSIFSQNYVASVTVVELYWKSGHEWHALLRADLYLNGILQIPHVDYEPDEYSYQWQLFNDITGNWDDKSTLITQGTDGQANQSFDWRVQISGEGFQCQSSVRKVVKYGIIKAVNVNAYDKDNNNINSMVNVNIWAEYSWYNRYPGMNYFLSKDEYNYLKDSVKNPQQFNQLFYKWKTNDGEEYFRNHESIMVSNNTSAIDVYHKRFNDVQINFNVLTEIPSLNILLKDPWLVKNTSNYFEAPYGYRNLGFLAIPEEVTGATHKVLLNQNDTTKPIYKISIPSNIYLPQSGKNHKVYLRNWSSVSGATLQYPNSLSTGIVFTNSSGCNITANIKLTQLSNQTDAYSNNSQRKFLRTTSPYPYTNSRLHSVYESMGKVWYETSTDNGST